MAYDNDAFANSFWGGGGLNWRDPSDSTGAYESPSDTGNPSWNVYSPWQTTRAAIAPLQDHSGFQEQGFNLDFQDSESGLSGNQKELDRFNNWMTNQGLRVGQASQGGVGYTNVFDKNNNAVGKTQTVSDSNVGFDLAVAAMLGAATGGVGAAYGWGPAATGAATGAAQGAMLSSGDPQAALQGGVAGGLGGLASTYNPAGQMGIENRYLRDAFNRGSYGGLSSMARGGKFGQGAMAGAMSPMINYGASQVGLMPSGSPQGINSWDSIPGVTKAGDWSNWGTQGPSGFDLDPMAMQNRSGGQTEQAAGADDGASFTSFMSSIMPKGFDGGTINVGNLASGLAGLYQGYDQRRKAKQMMKQMSGNFGNNSPYAKNLRNELSRKDAAAGRRSQYGPREVELQARLAEMNARQAPGLAQLYGMQNQGGNAMFNNLLNLGKTTGLFNMMQGGQYQQPQRWSSEWALGPNAGPQMPGY